jgi:uncharacterized protein
MLRLSRLNFAQLGFAACTLLWPLLGRAQCPPAPDLEQAIKATPIAQVKNTGYLWSLDKAGHTSYLHGTIHLAQQQWATPSAQTIRALATSDLLALEINLMDPAIVKETQESLKKLGTGQAISPALIERIGLLAQKLCATEIKISDQGVAYQLIQLMFADARYAGLEALFGRDVVMGVFAQTLKKPIESLESVQTQMQALDGELNDEQVSQYLDRLEQGKLRGPLEKITQAWAANDLETLENYEQWCECKDDAVAGQSMAKINDDRNPGLAQAIDALHIQGKKVFVAVGSLHMTGAQALPLLLQNMGYIVRRVF